MPAPAFIHVNTAIGAGVTSVDVTIPSGAQGAAAGDFAVLAAAITPSTITSPTGWDALPDTPTTATAASGKFYVWTKTLASGDLGATLTLTLGASSRIAVACAAFDPASIDVSGKDETNTSGTSVTAPSVTTTVADTTLVTIHGVISNANGVQPTWTVATGMTEQADITSNHGSARNATLELSTETLTASGATGTRVATSSDSVQRQGITIALKASGGTTFTQTHTGSTTPTGSLAKQDQKPTTGSTTPAGAVAKQAQKATTGSTTPTGALAKLISKALSGSSTPSGALANAVVKILALAGSVTPTGSLAKQVDKQATGSTTPTSTVAKAISKATTGATTPAGALLKLIGRVLAGSTTPSGAVTASLVGAAAKATSTPTVTATYTSTPTTTAPNTSTSTVGSAATSTSTVT